ncbi:alpha/beta hydrolase [Alcanivorax hongdengensis A-11-3]|uniref:Alpha/beta hydrolase n=1 Tax=Alcanivorax hongdengensis A-11-3 TaxID=1177179 RepID=L0WAB2_9GAMM|nr:alpha/beta hydrolase [Alcanivorax hongdengensis]EKF73881.1 alpha/beta hydrolase [Alcanivorax hongdengensis A-11-3]
MSETTRLGPHRLETCRAGQGEQTVVLVHGWSCRAGQWADVLATPPEGVTLLAPDLPGHGASRHIPLDSWTVTGLAEALVAALEGIDKPILVGHSMGGAVVLEAARRMPVAAVVLVDTFVIPYGDVDEETARQIEQPFHADFGAAMADLVEANGGPHMNAPTRQALAEDMAASPTDAMLPLWSDLLRWSPEAAFAELQCPLHAINGDLIGDVARARCEGRVTEWHLAGSGHFPQLDQPQAFRALFARVLDAVAG